MTTLENLNFGQVSSLGYEAIAAGDESMRRDCELLVEAYLGSDASELSELIDCLRGEEREAARRIVLAIQDDEARLERRASLSLSESGPLFDTPLLAVR